MFLRAIIVKGVVTFLVSTEMSSALSVKRQTDIDEVPSETLINWKPGYNGPTNTKAGDICRTEVEGDNMCKEASNCEYAYDEFGECVPTLYENGVLGNLSTLLTKRGSILEERDCYTSTHLTTGSQNVRMGDYEPKWLYSQAVYDKCGYGGCDSNDIYRYNVKVIRNGYLTYANIGAKVEGAWGDGWNGRNGAAEGFKETLIPMHRAWQESANGNWHWQNECSNQMQLTMYKTCNGDTRFDGFIKVTTWNNAQSWWKSDWCEVLTSTASNIISLWNKSAGVLAGFLGGVGCSYQ